ncbi:MAG TPA: cbb3-type cytochrome c oxidase subunit I [Terriglobales bacterium]|nr:cbb3-type cytochrome c oxidase subunit I [Terriglobales bacterium]
MKEPSSHHDPSGLTAARGSDRVVGRLFSHDHKIIGIEYLALSLIAVAAGMALSLLMRIHIVWPLAKLPILGQTLPEDYLAWVTMHGTIMVFFVLTTAPQSALGNYLLPLQIGAREMAFPWLNLAGFWTTALSFLVMMAAFFVPGGAPISGWSQYTPMSAIPAPGDALGMDLWIVSIGIFCIASVMGSINFIVTPLRSRARGMSLMRMPLTVWSWMVTAVLTALSFSVLFGAAIMLLCDRHFGTNFFVPGGLVLSGKLIDHHGGSPLLWQHLFWFFGHPEVYIAILPGMGTVSTILSTFSRRPVFGYRAMVYATVAIGFLGFLVWGHHMFVSGMNIYAVDAFSAVTLVIAVPSSVKTVNWLGTMWGGRLRLTTPMLFAIGFVSFFISGGVTGPLLAEPELNQYLHGTYFVVSHFHLIMAMASGFGIFAATYYWFPKMFGRMMNETLGRIHFVITFLGAYAIFLPMYVLGLAAHPRRYAQLFGSADYLQPLLPIQKFITIAAFITAAAQLIFLWNFFWSLRHGKTAGENPWQATTLEWSTASPPVPGNFLELPVIYRGAYEFAPANDPDFHPQWLAEEAEK